MAVFIVQKVGIFIYMYRRKYVRLTLYNQI